MPSVQRALRTAQDLESLHIEEAAKDAGRPLEVDAVEMRGDWTFGAYVVDQKADTAQRHIGCAIRLRHLQVRNAGGESIDIRDAGYPHRVARYRRDRQWRLLDGLDRKSVVEGKSVSVRVGLGGGRFIKNKK